MLPADVSKVVEELIGPRCVVFSIACPNCQKWAKIDSVFAPSVELDPDETLVRQVEVLESAIAWRMMVLDRRQADKSKVVRSDRERVMQLVDSLLLRLQAVAAGDPETVKLVSLAKEFVSGV